MNELCLNLGLAIRAIVGLSVLSANSDAILEGLSLMSKMEVEIPKHAPKVFLQISGNMKAFLKML